MDVDISVVMTIYNRANLLDKTLSSFSRQTFPKKQYEIVLVDDQSTDNIEEVLQKHKDLRIQHIIMDRNKSHYPATSNCPALGLNIGFKQARAEIIYKTDPEMYQVGETLNHAWESFRPNRMTFGQAYWLSEYFTNICGRIEDEEILGVGKEGNDPNITPLVTPSVRAPLYFIAVMPRSAILEIGGIDEQFMQGIACDDDDFAERLQVQGCMWDWNWNITGLHCVYYNTPVLLADGTTRKMGDIVMNRLNTEVMSMNVMTGDLEPKKISNWYINPVLGRKMYKIRYKNSTGENEDIKYHRKQVLLTEDHEILTTEGWLQVKDLSENSKVITSEPCPNLKQMEIVNGSLLGDGCISNSRSKKIESRYSFSFVGLTKHEDYHEIRSIKGFKWGIVKNKNEFGYIGDKVFKKQPSCTHNTSVGGIWKELRDKWYVNGIKEVPVDIELTPLTLAVWYMDDGSLGGRKDYIAKTARKFEDNRRTVQLATMGFSTESLIILQQKFRDLNYKCNIQKDNSLRLTVESSRKFFNVVSPYIPESMRYKLPNELNWPEYDSSLWDCGTPNRYVDNIEVEEEIRSNKLVYCIDVEDNHNFISYGMVLHNCYHGPLWWQKPGWGFDSPAYQRNRKILDTRMNLLGRSIYNRPPFDFSSWEDEARSKFYKVNQEHDWGNAIISKRILE